MDAPHKWRTPTYGRHTQLNIPTDTSPLLTPAASLLLQSTVGSLLFYSRAVDPSMLPALNEISTQQSNPTTNTQSKVTQLLNYVATHPNAVICFHKSVRTVVASAAEAEMHGIFHNAQTVLPIRFLLDQMGHIQPPTPLKTDNKIAEAFVKQEMRHKKSKSWDMRLWWLKDKLVQKHFKIFWDSGTQNWADYFTKHFAPKYHRILRQRYLQCTNLVVTKILSSYFNK